jgi:hypothetical protein
MPILGYNPAMYKIIFLNNNEVYEIYAKQIAESDLFGFIEVEQLIFKQPSTLVVDPSQERLQNEFTGVKRSYIPVHLILRMDKVEKTGTAKVVDGVSQKVTPFPSKLYQPTRD